MRSRKNSQHPHAEVNWKIYLDSLHGHAFSDLSPSDYKFLLLEVIVSLNSFNYFLAFPKQIPALVIMNDTSATDEAKTKARKTFGAFHGMSMLANFACMAANVLYVHAVSAALDSRW